MNYPQSAARFIMDTLFPVRCIGCGIYDVYFCPLCLASVRVRNDFECVGCRRPVEAGATCSRCRNDFVISRFFVATDYKDKLIQKAIKVFKYGFIRDMAQPLAQILETYSESVSLNSKLGVSPLVVPVPLYKKRLNWRGFNQSEVLAKRVAELFKLDLRTDVLIRTQNNPPQADTKDRESRIKNVKASFECLGELGGRDVILVDDISTTGATLNECAKVLAEKGAGKISALVIARG